MSCFVVKISTIENITRTMEAARIATHIECPVRRALGHQFDDGDSIRKFMSDLTKANEDIYARKYREQNACVFETLYPTDSAWYRAVLTHTARKLDAVELVRAFDCLIYQLSEDCATPEQEILTERLRSLSKDICCNLVHDTVEYRSAQWG